MSDDVIELAIRRVAARCKSKAAQHAMLELHGEILGNLADEIVRIRMEREATPNTGNEGR